MTAHLTSHARVSRACDKVRQPSTEEAEKPSQSPPIKSLRHISKTPPKPQAPYGAIKMANQDRAPLSNAQKPTGGKCAHRRSHRQSANGLRHTAFITLTDLADLLARYGTRLGRCRCAQPLEVSYHVLSLTGYEVGHMGKLQEAATTGPNSAGRSCISRIRTKKIAAWRKARCNPPHPYQSRRTNGGDVRGVLEYSFDPLGPKPSLPLVPVLKQSVESAAAHNLTMGETCFPAVFGVWFMQLCGVALRLTGDSVHDDGECIGISSTRPGSRVAGSFMSPCTSCMSSL